MLGFQHLLAMYSGDVLVPLLIGNFLHFNAAQMTYLVSIDIFMCGIATLLQLRKTPLTGIGLPVVLGCVVQSVAPLESIGGKLGIAYMYGAIICAGIFVFLIAGLFAKMTVSTSRNWILDYHYRFYAGSSRFSKSRRWLSSCQVIRCASQLSNRLFNDCHHFGNQCICQGFC